MGRLHVIVYRPPPAVHDAPVHVGRLDDPRVEGGHALPTVVAVQAVVAKVEPLPPQADVPVPHQQRLLVPGEVLHAPPLLQHGGRLERDLGLDVLQPPADVHQLPGGEVGVDGGGRRRRRLPPPLHRHVRVPVGPRLDRVVRPVKLCRRVPGGLPLLRLPGGPPPRQPHRHLEPEHADGEPLASQLVHPWLGLP